MQIKTWKVWVKHREMQPFKKRFMKTFWTNKEAVKYLKEFDDNSYIYFIRRRGGITILYSGKSTLK